MSTIKTKDGTEIYYKDWGTGRPVTFSHGWPLNADAWDAQMMFLAARGFRCISHDRRGHGRSGQPWDGNNLDTYADDLSALMEALDINGAVMIGHSTGGGEVTRYLGRHGTARVAKAVLMSAIPPLMLKTQAKPRRPSDRSLRRHTRRGCGRSIAILSRAQPAVLRREPAWVEGVARRQGRLLDVVDAGWVEGCL